MEPKNRQFGDIRAKNRQFGDIAAKNCRFGPNLQFWRIEHCVNIAIFVNLRNFAENLWEIPSKSRLFFYRLPYRYRR